MTSLCLKLWMAHALCTSIAANIWQPVTSRIRIQKLTETPVKYLGFTNFLPFLGKICRNLLHIYPCLALPFVPLHRKLTFLANLTKWLKAVEVTTKNCLPRLTQKIANVSYENLVPLCIKFLAHASYVFPGWTQPLTDLSFT